MEIILNLCLLSVAVIASNDELVSRQHKVFYQLYNQDIFKNCDGSSKFSIVYERISIMIDHKWVQKPANKINGFY